MKTHIARATGDATAVVSPAGEGFNLSEVNS